jgi:NAD(P)-dependent dehydrogenase (short-subunit alcohol dehydrogenase family)
VSLRAGVRVLLAVTIAVRKIGMSDLKDRVALVTGGSRGIGFDRAMAINLKSVFLCTQEILPGMRARCWGYG